MKLKELAPQVYASEVLPHSAELWAGRRDYETYVSQTLEVANSGYGKRHFRFMGFYDGQALAASCKSYARTIAYGHHRLNALGIGAVFTPAQLRGRGYASAMLALFLDTARAQGIDVVYLFSDIRPEFYAEIGFTELPSRRLSLRADGLPASRVQVVRLDSAAWPGVRRCFDLSERTRTWHFVRTPLVWEWLKLRMRHGSERSIGTEMNLVVYRGRSIAAYVLGARAPEHDLYILDEFGYCDDDAAALIPPLLRNAAGDLRRITTWLPPSGARHLLPRGSVRKRAEAILMAAALTPAGRTWLTAATLPQVYDGVWSADHI